MRHARRVVHTSASDIADQYVAARILARLDELGMSQGQLSQVIGVSYQQVFKYRHGLNRIMAGRLHNIAAALEVPVGYFYEGLPGVDRVYELPGSSPTARFVRDVMHIKNEGHRDGIYHATRQLASREQEE